MDARAVAEAFVDALAAKDRGALTSVLASDINFRGLTPNDEYRATSPGEVADVIFGSWFEPADHITEVLARTTWAVAGRLGLSYRFRVESEGETFFVEQQGFLDTTDERITRLSLMCAGFRPWVEAQEGGSRRP